MFQVLASPISLYLIYYQALQYLNQTYRKNTKKLLQNFTKQLTQPWVTSSNIPKVSKSRCYKIKIGLEEKNIEFANLTEDFFTEFSDFEREKTFFPYE